LHAESESEENRIQNHERSLCEELELENVATYSHD